MESRWPEFVCVLVVLEVDVVVVVCPVPGDVLGLVCATTHVAQNSSSESNVVLLFIKPSRGLVLFCLIAFFFSLRRSPGRGYPVESLNFSRF